VIYEGAAAPAKAEQDLVGRPDEIEADDEQEE
jgi:hypothetical protein